MDLRLEGKTAIVTGGSAGIGKGIAGEFAKAGGNVMIVSRKAEKCEAAADELKALGGGQIDWRAGHTGDLEGGAQIMDETIERFGSLDILVNNAATNPHAGPVIDCAPSAFDKTYEVNLRGPWLWTQNAWQKWMQEHGGSVINIASVGGYSTSAALGVYCILKSALIHMTKQLGAEMGPGVRVNCIAPGLIRTDFAKVLWEGDRGATIAQGYPLKRLGEPEDIGKAALWLAADASWMTGQTLVLDGGELITIGAEPPLA
ncbi:MAG: SDR family oxidoreductase [Actinomycetia bacterium]|nr:SDR family oxidoreductase [Actinomycetes bacterium]MCP4083576.1 SDR family oxidoreductase [Actinomycetes bacterium]